MNSINIYNKELLELKKERDSLEVDCKDIGEMLPVCMILRYKKKGITGFKRMKVSNKITNKVSTYGYMTFLENGKTKHVYIKKPNLKKVIELSARYKEFNSKMQRLREINKEVLELFNKISNARKLNVHQFIKNHRY